MCLDVDYAAKELEFDAKKLPRDPQQLSGFIKNRIAAKLRASPSTQTCSEVVANFVRSAPPRVFKNWLQNPAFSAFYDECRRIASLYDCDTSNER
ncbi:MAG: hypothetical protein JXA69_03300 [Phycisphaerae bacterium]|nr:hypothetical protein [Phycisphaerae bacterium]